MENKYILDKRIINEIIEEEKKSLGSLDWSEEQIVFVNFGNERKEATSVKFSKNKDLKLFLEVRWGNSPEQGWSGNVENVKEFKDYPAFTKIGIQ